MLQKPGPADAHDAGRGPWVQTAWLTNGQLMLMMLAGALHPTTPTSCMGKTWALQVPADAHDAGLLFVDVAKSRPADAHDAGHGGGWLMQKQGQLMLMMLACLGAAAPTRPS